MPIKNYALAAPSGTAGHESWPERKAPPSFRGLCSGCRTICTRSYQRALLMIRINDAAYMAHSCSPPDAPATSCTWASFEIRTSISLVVGSLVSLRLRSSSPFSPALAAAFAYKLLLMSRYQSDCINVAFLPCLGHSQFPVTGALFPIPAIPFDSMH